MDTSNLAREIGRIENRANVDIMKLGITIKSVELTFAKMEFKGEIPKIMLDCLEEQWPACYCEEEGKIIINMSAPQNPLSCGFMNLSSAVSWAAAMHVLHKSDSCLDSEERKEIAYKISREISGKISCC